uniref:DUF3110 domain-containing protein n=1 Tax=Caenorhabditis tropicalis TaxID=1561998 RepID=A0A1I7SXF2_9PELO
MFSSRCIIDNQKYTSEMWTREKTTTASQGIAVIDGSTTYGTILLFIEQRGRVFALFSPWTCSNPIATMEHELQSEMNAEQQEMMAKYSSRNVDFVEKVDNSGIAKLITADSLVGHFVKLKYKKRTFAFSCFS